MEDLNNDTIKSIEMCQKVLRLFTGLILAAFISIILLTTFSTGAFVQVAGKILYFTIVSSGIACLVVWLYRGKLEKRLAPDNT